jgi:hypothetical protein
MRVKYYSKYGATKGAAENYSARTPWLVITKEFETKTGARRALSKRKHARDPNLKAKIRGASAALMILREDALKRCAIAARIN